MTRYFHGGPEGLTEVLPPTITGQPSLADHGGAGVCRKDRVYVTTSAVSAWWFAMMAPTKGAVAVYEVRPTGDIVPDPDCNEPGLSWECERASVEGIVARISYEQRTIWLRSQSWARLL